MGNTLAQSLTEGDLTKLAFESLPIAAVILDKHAEIILMNERACVLLDSACESLIGKQLHDVVGVMDSKGETLSRLPLEQVFQLGLSHASEGVVLKAASHKKGSQYAVVVVPITDADRRTVGAVMTLSLASKSGNARPQFGNEPVAEAPTAQKQSLYVRSGGRYVRVLVAELLWVEAMENYVQLQTIKEKVTVHATLKSMDDALNDKGFQRIHRSFIVRKEDIERIEENHVIVNGTALPIGKSYRTELLDSLMLI